MRQKFEENRNIKDPIKAKQVLDQAREKFEYIRHPDPVRCKFLKFCFSFFFSLTMLVPFLAALDHILSRGSEKSLYYQTRVNPLTLSQHHLYTIFIWSRLCVESKTKDWCQLCQLCVYSVLSHLWQKKKKRAVMQDWHFRHN